MRNSLELRIPMAYCKTTPLRVNREMENGWLFWWLHFHTVAPRCLEFRAWTSAWLLPPWIILDRMIGLYSILHISCITMRETVWITKKQAVLTASVSICQHPWNSCHAYCHVLPINWEQSAARTCNELSCSKLLATKKYDLKVQWIDLIYRKPWIFPWRSCRFSCKMFP